MEKLDGLYLLFSCRELYYLLPLSWVKQVLEDKDQNEEWMFLDFALLADGENGKADHKYLILLEYQGEELGISVENVMGIQHIEEERFVLLDGLVINERNRYLSAVVQTETEEGNQMTAYLLNPEFLYKAAGSV